MYISEKIEMNTYAAWLNGEKVIISAPTGTGKTTFILQHFLPYCKSRGRRMLILCNRRLLKMQYGFELSEQYARYEELLEDVDVLTYQALAGYLTDSQGLQVLLEGYDVIVCDEVHFFYADADFNGLGTYVLLQALVLACFFKTVIMITATLEEVRPLLIQTFKQCEKKLMEEIKKCPKFEDYCWRDRIYDFGKYGNYGWFQGIFVEDEETLAEEILKSDKKTLIFIDDKNKAESLKKMFMKMGKLENQDIYVLTAETLETRPNDVVIRALAITHKVLPQILITTSVLDNGVSIQDEDIGNVVIATESETSFLQMLGRVRAESVDSCNLYIFPRSVEYYEKRVRQYEEKMLLFEELERKSLNNHELNLLQQGWFGSDEKADFLRKALVITEESVEFYSMKPAFVRIRFGGAILAVNAFAKAKTGDMLLVEKRLYKRAMQGKEQAAFEQFGWIGKNPEELKVIASSYIEGRKRSLREDLLEIQNFTKEEVISKKKELGEKYRKDILSNVVAKNGSFCVQKLKKICEQYQLKLQIQLGEDKKNRYTVKEEE